MGKDDKKWGEGVAVTGVRKHYKDPFPEAWGTPRGAGAENEQDWVRSPRNLTLVEICQISDLQGASLSLWQKSLGGVKQLVWKTTGALAPSTSMFNNS